MRTRATSSSRLSSEPETASRSASADIGRIRERPPLRRESHAACVALKQRHAERRLQPADVMTDGAGGEMQLLRGMREVLVPGRRREHGEGGQDGRADRHETQAIFVADARSMRLQLHCLQREMRQTEARFVSGHPQSG